MGKKTGRPSKKTPDVVTKLLTAFSAGYNDTEACFYADISRETYYRWLQEMPEFRDKIEVAKSVLNMKAKDLLVAAIGQGDLNAAKWWLERRARKEFDKTDSDREELPSSYREVQKIMKESLAGVEELVCMPYRGLLFLEREQMLAKGLLRKPNEKTRIDELLALPNAKLADYIQLEVYATGRDKAHVKQWLDERQDLIKDLKRIVNEVVTV